MRGGRTAEDARARGERRVALASSRRLLLSGGAAIVAGLFFLWRWVFVIPTRPSFIELYGYTLEMKLSSGKVYVIPFTGLAGMLALLGGLSVIAVAVRMRRG